MLELREMYATIEIENTWDILRLDPGDMVSEPMLNRIAGLARRYPNPHNVLGRPSADEYVRRLALEGHRAGQGWFVCLNGETVAAAVHLADYGRAHLPGHRLWKLRHPLMDSRTSFSSLTRLLSRVVAAAVEEFPGSHKFVLFLSEMETVALTAAKAAGFMVEGRLEDFYRFGETCLILGFSHPPGMPETVS